MFAIEESASIFCARVMRGTWSIASTVSFFSAILARSGSFCAGQRKLTRVCPSLVRSSSSLPSAGCAIGGRTLSTMSASFQIASAVSATDAPTPS